MYHKSAILKAIVNHTLGRFPITPATARFLVETFQCLWHVEVAHKTNVLAIDSLSTSSISSNEGRSVCLRVFSQAKARQNPGNSRKWNFLRVLIAYHSEDVRCWEEQDTTHAGNKADASCGVRNCIRTELKDDMLIYIYEGRGECLGIRLTRCAKLVESTIKGNWTTTRNLNGSVHNQKHHVNPW